MGKLSSSGRVADYTSKAAERCACPCFGFQVCLCFKELASVGFKKLSCSNLSSHRLRSAVFAISREAAESGHMALPGYRNV